MARRQLRRRNAPSVFDLSGAGTTIGGSAGSSGRSGGLDVVSGTGANGQPAITVQVGAQGSVQISVVPVAGPYEVHVIQGTTQVQSIDPIGFIQGALDDFLAGSTSGVPF